MVRICTISGEGPLLAGAAALLLEVAPGPPGLLLVGGVAPVEGAPFGLFDPDGDAEVGDAAADELELRLRHAWNCGSGSWNAAKDARKSVPVFSTLENWLRHELAIPELTMRFVIVLAAG